MKQETAMQQSPTFPILSREILSVPASIRMQSLSDNDNVTSLSSCSEGLTLFQILDGLAEVQVDEQSVDLAPGDAILVNANRSIRFSSPKSCQFYKIVVDPILFQNSICLPNYLASLTAPSSPAYFLLRRESEGAQYIANALSRISKLDNAHLVPFRMEVVGYLHLIFAQFLEIPYCDASLASEEILPESHNLDRMLNFIHKNFQSKIQLIDIAEAGNVSRSRCSPLFRKYLHMTPIEYVNNYRLDVSRGYLMDRNLSIASVANTCGFTGQSYYTKLFVRRYGYTPSEYRSRISV